MTKKVNRHRGAQHRSPQAATAPVEPTDATVFESSFSLDARGTEKASLEHHTSGSSPLTSTEDLAEEHVAPPAEAPASKSSPDFAPNNDTVGDITPAAAAEMLCEPPCNKSFEEAATASQATVDDTLHDESRSQPTMASSTAEPTPNQAKGTPQAASQASHEPAASEKVKEAMSKASAAAAAPGVAASASLSSPSPAPAPTSPLPNHSSTPNVQESCAAATQSGCDCSPPPDTQESLLITPNKVQPISESGSDSSPPPAVGDGSVKKAPEALPKMSAFTFSSGSVPTAPSPPSASRDASPAFGSLKVREFAFGSSNSSPPAASAPSVTQEGAAQPAGFQFGRSESGMAAASGSSARLRPGARGKTAAATTDAASSGNAFTGFTQLSTAAVPNPFASNAFGSAAQPFSFGSAAAGTSAVSSFAASVQHGNSSSGDSQDVMALMRAMQERFERRFAECGERLAASEQRLTQQDKVNHELRLELNLVKAKLGLKDSAAVLEFLSQCGEGIVGGADACLYVYGGVAGVTGRALQRQQAQFERQVVHVSQVVLNHVLSERSLRHLQLRMGLTTPVDSAQLANNGGLAWLLEANLSRFYEEILHEVDQRSMHAVAHCQKLAVVCEGHCEEAERKLWLATPPKLRDNTAVSFPTQGTSSRIQELQSRIDVYCSSSHSAEAHPKSQGAQSDDQSLDNGSKIVPSPAPLDLKETLSILAPDGIKNDGASTGINSEPAPAPATIGSNDGPPPTGIKDGPALAAAPNGNEDDPSPPSTGNKDDPSPAPTGNKDILKNLKSADNQLGTGAPELLHARDFLLVML